MAARPEKLAALGYTEAWARAGIVDDALLDAQFDPWERTAEPTEHLRWWAIQSFLENREELRDDALAQVLEIARSDPKLHLVILHALAAWPGLGEAQRERLRAESPDASFAREIVRGAHRLALRAAMPGDAAVQAALASGDGLIANDLLARELLDVEQLAHLSEHGSSRQIRARARQQRIRRRP